MLTGWPLNAQLNLQQENTIEYNIYFTSIR